MRDVLGPFHEVPCPLCMAKIREDCTTADGPPYAHVERAELYDGYLAGREDALWTVEAVQARWLGPDFQRISADRERRIMAGIYKETELGGLFAPPSPAPPQPAPDARTRRQIGPARAAAEKRRDRALKAAERPQLAAYRDQALAFFRSFAETHEFVFCDDLWAAGMPEPPGSRKAFGAVMAKAKRNGWIEETGETRQSVSSNLSKKPVYRSLLYRGHVGQAS